MTTTFNRDIDFEDLAEYYAGNWQEFTCFAWHNIPEDAEDYCIVYTENRDSEVLERANSEAIRRVLKRCKCAYEETHHHWAVGWVKGWVIRVYDKRGRVTSAFKRYCELQWKVDDYPILDEELFAEFELEEQEESWENVVKDEFRRETEKRFPEHDFDFSDGAGAEEDAGAKDESDTVETDKPAGARRITVRRYFDLLGEKANVYWEDGYIDIARIVAAVDLADCPFLIRYRVRYIDVGEVTEEFDKEQEALQRIAGLQAAGHCPAYEVIQPNKTAGKEE